jgi:DNA-binding NarL/FixJ family response regulator
VLQAVQEQDYDVLVLDISMPDGGGLEVLRQLETLKPQLRVVVLSVYPEEQYAERVLKAGVAGYLTKETIPEQLLTAIRHAASGRRYITPSLAEKLAAGLGRAGEREPHETLSNREYQVMTRLAAGRTVTEIAAELSLSVKTISTYRSRILEKLGLATTAELIRYALERGLVE